MRNTVEPRDHRSAFDAFRERGPPRNRHEIRWLTARTKGMTHAR